MPLKRGSTASLAEKSQSAESTVGFSAGQFDRLHMRFNPKYKFTHNVAIYSVRANAIEQDRMCVCVGKVCTFFARTSEALPLAAKLQAKEL